MTDLGKLLTEYAMVQATLRDTVVQDDALLYQYYTAQEKLLRAALPAPAPLLVSRDHPARRTVQ